MPKPKRNISSDALLRRQEYLTGGMETQPEDLETSERQTTVAVQAVPEIVQETPPVSGDKPKPTLEPDESVQEGSAQEESVSPQTLSPQALPPQALSKKQLLQQYLATQHGDIEMDTIYFPSELYQAFRNVWTERKKKQRGFKKSYIVIEALLRHPEILEELQKQGMLKQGTVKE